MNRNLFELVSYVLALSAFIKVFFGVFYHNKLYQWAKLHYSKKQWTLPIRLLLAYAIILLALIWYATLFSYVKFGWILTVFITIASAKSLNLLFNWQRTAPQFVKFIDLAGEKLWLVDLVVLALGIIFLFLGLFIY